MEHDELLVNDHIRSSPMEERHGY